MTFMIKKSRKAKAIARSDIDPRQVNRAVFLTLITVSLYLLMHSNAYAQWDMVLCTVADFLVGNLGRGLATLAVIIVGVGATLGKVSWGMAVLVAVGIAVIFNAPDIVTALNAGQDGCDAP